MREKENIRIAILKKYKTLGDFAKKHGIRQSNLSKWLENPSSRFIAILQKEGIETKSGEMVKDEREIKDYAEVIKELKGIIYEKNNLIKEQASLLMSKDKMISQLEKLINLYDRVKE